MLQSWMKCLRVPSVGAIEMSPHSLSFALFRSSSLARVNVVGGRFEENRLSLVNHWQPFLKKKEFHASQKRASTVVREVLYRIQDLVPVALDRFRSEL